MKIYYSNYKDFYKNPTSADFSADNVSVRERHLNDVIPLWGIGNEKDGVVEWKQQHSLTIKSKSNQTPLILKIITEDGINHFFYKTTPIRAVNDTDGETWYENNYELNVWDTIVHRGIQKLKQANPNVNFLSKFADRLIFYGRLKELDITTSPLLLPDKQPQTIKDALCGIFGEDRPYLADYINIIEITDTTVKFSGIVKEEDGLYYLGSDKPTQTEIITGTIDINDTHKITDNKQQTNILRYVLNVYLQKQFGDVQKSSQPQLIRVKIGDKTETDLYGYNEIDPNKETITFTHFMEQTTTKQFTPQQLDEIYKRVQNNYEYIGIRGSSLKNWTRTGIDKDHPYGTNWDCRSASGQRIEILPINPTTLIKLNNIEYYLYPPSDMGGEAGGVRYFGQDPKPWLVQIDALDTKSTLTQVFLSDIPVGLLLMCAIKATNRATGEGANIGGDVDETKPAPYNSGNDNYSIPFLRIEANTKIPIKISGLDEEESMEGRIKQIMVEATAGKYSWLSEPYLLNPRFFYESIMYDTGNLMRFDIKWINYDIGSQNLTLEGLIINANICYTNTEDIYWDFGEMNNELCTEWNNNKTNLRIENIRTCACFGENANTYLNGSATASYTNYLNNVAQYQNRMQNYEIEQTQSAFNFIGGEIKDIATGNFGKMVGDAMGMGTRTAKSAINLEYDNERQARDYRNSINNVTSSANMMVSKPYISSFGEQTGLFTRYANKLQEGEQKNIFANVMYHGYIYNSVAPFNTYDNRVIFNKIKISNNLNIEFIEQILQDDTTYGSIEYAKLIISGLIGGFKLGKPTHIIDMGTAQNNLENILPPSATQKVNIDTVITDTQQYGCINTDNDTSISFDIGSDNRKRMVEAIKTINPDTPDGLINQLMTDPTIEGLYKQDIDELTITCTNKTLDYYGFLVFNNLQIIRLATIKNQFKPFVFFEYPAEFTLDGYFQNHLNVCERTLNLILTEKPQYKIQSGNTWSVDLYFKNTRTQTAGETEIGFDITSQMGTLLFTQLSWTITAPWELKQIQSSFDKNNNLLYSMGGSTRGNETRGDEWWGQVGYYFDFINKQLKFYQAGVYLHGYNTSQAMKYDFGVFGSKNAENWNFNGTDGTDLTTAMGTDGLGYKIRRDIGTGYFQTTAQGGQSDSVLQNIYGITDNGPLKYYTGLDKIDYTHSCWSNIWEDSTGGTTGGTYNIILHTDDHELPDITLTLDIVRDQDLQETLANLKK